jgi:hypothetical protein
VISTRKNARRMLLPVAKPTQSDEIGPRTFFGFRLVPTPLGPRAATRVPSSDNRTLAHGKETRLLMGGDRRKTGLRPRQSYNVHLWWDGRRLRSESEHIVRE